MAKKNLFNNQEIESLAQMYAQSDFVPYINQSTGCILEIRLNEHPTQLLIAGELSYVPSDPD